MGDHGTQEERNNARESHLARGNIMCVRMELFGNHQTVVIARACNHVVRKRKKKRMRNCTQKQEERQRKAHKARSNKLAADTDDASAETMLMLSVNI